MLYGLLASLFVLVCILLIIIILVQKGKSSMGMGGLGGSTQLLFGGSGGQDLFQKITWGLGATFMIGSLVLAILKEESSPLLRNIARQGQDANKAISAPEEIKAESKQEPLSGSALQDKQEQEQEAQ